MLRVAIVDDEPLARQGMRQLLTRHRTVELVGEASSVKDAIDLIRRERPDAVFLDIELYGLNAFDVLGELTDPPDIVLVTAHSQYALKAYEFAVVDYLLKPVHPKRLTAAIARLEKVQAARRATSHARQLAEIPVLRIEMRNKTVLIRTETIVALCAEGDYTRIVAENMPATLTAQAIGKLAALLPTPPFIRVSRSLMINGSRLREIDRIERDDTRIRLDGCEESFLLGRVAAARLKRANPAAG